MRKRKQVHSKDFILIAITFVTILGCATLTALMADIINDQREVIIGLTKENETRKVEKCLMEEEEQQ